MKRYDVKNIVFSSSCTVYWTPSKIPVDETMSLGKTTNPYGKTKQLLESILQDYSDFALFSAICLRYFNPIGAHPSGHIWEDPQGIPNNLLPYVLKVLSWELDFVKVFWDDYPTKDGTWVRDYIDILDLIDGHLKAYQYLESKEKKSGLFDYFNLGTGKWISVLELIRWVEKVSWKKIPYEIFWRRDGDLAEIYGDVRKALEILWWEAVNSVEFSLENAIKFVHNQ